MGLRACACTTHLLTLQLSASRVSLEPLQDAAAELVEGLHLVTGRVALARTR